MITSQTVTPRVQRVGLFKAALFAALLPIFGVMSFVVPQKATAQHFTSDASDLKRVVMEADDLDSIIYTRSAHFPVPAIHDTIGLVYHEPMPDSMMPRSAIILGTVMIQGEEAEDVVEKMEEFARKQGADWVISFEEPRRRKNREGEFYYRSTATLMRVLDDAMIPQSQVAYSTFNESGHKNYAAVMSWYDTYGRHMGANVKELEREVEAESEENSEVDW